MSGNFIKVAFDGTQDYVDVTLPSAFAASNLQAGGPIRVTLTTRSATTVRVEPATRFTGTIVLSQLSVYVAPTPPVPPAPGNTAYAGFQLVNSTNASSSAVFARPLYLPSDVTSVKLHFANKQVFGNIGSSATINIAVYVSDPTQTNKVGALLGNYSSQVVPGDGGEIVIGPVPVTRGADGKIVVAYSIPASGTIAWALYDYHGWYINSTEVVSPLAPPSQLSPVGAFWIHVEYTTSKRRFVVLGDSISIGATNASDPTTTGGYEATCWYQLGLQKDFSVDIEGYGGAELRERNDPATYPILWGTIPNLAVDDVVIELCTNDSQFTSTAMKTYLLGLIAKIQAVAPLARIWAVTGAPAQVYITNDAYRIAYNNDIRANYASYGLAGIFDFDLALRDPATPTQLLPAYNSDGTHWLATGQNAALAVVKTQLGI